jgi:hypothetical protein
MTPPISGRSQLPARGPKPANPAKSVERAKTGPEKVVNPPTRTERKAGPYTGNAKK